MSPTQRTLAMLREAGWLAEVVEKWIPGANIRKDLWGFVDIVAIREGETLGVQATSGSNLQSRVSKIAEHPNLPAVRRAGWTLWAVGWRKLKGKWCPRIVELS